MNTNGAYAGLRVLDLGQGVAAPYCAMLLAMHGAEVIKLEPLGGDWSRGLGTRNGWIMVALVREEQYARFAAALGRPDLAEDPRFADFAARAAHATTRRARSRYSQRARR
jgi:crotonobetainyl-CoA:carnitine CoA-transferase CaiB-like acyl-CoA transferase